MLGSLGFASCLLLALALPARSALAGSTCSTSFTVRKAYGLFFAYAYNNNDTVRAAPSRWDEFTDGKKQQTTLDCNTCDSCILEIRNDTWDQMNSQHAPGGVIYSGTVTKNACVSVRVDNKVATVSSC